MGHLSTLGSFEAGCTAVVNATLLGTKACTSTCNGLSKGITGGGAEATSTSSYCWSECIEDADGEHCTIHPEKVVVNEVTSWKNEAEGDEAQVVGERKTPPWDATFNDSDRILVDRFAVDGIGDTEGGSWDPMRRARIARRTMSMPSGGGVPSGTYGSSTISAATPSSPPQLESVAPVAPASPLAPAPPVAPAPPAPAPSGGRPAKPVAVARVSGGSSFERSMETIKQEVLDGGYAQRVIDMYALSAKRLADRSEASAIASRSPPSGTSFLTSARK